jgi:hypothetical protein
VFVQNYARFVSINFSHILITLLRPDEVPTITSGKLALKYHGTDLDAMQAIATAAKKRSLADFNLVCFINFIFVFCFYYRHLGVIVPNCNVIML